MEREKILDELINSAAFESLSVDSKEAFRKEYAELKERREREEQEHAVRIELSRRECDERIKNELKERNRLLGLELGEWVRNIPRNRRFVIAYRIGYRFNGFVGEEKNQAKWEREDQYCVMDLLRGFKAPYFEYCTLGSVFDRIVKERLKPALEETDDEKLALHIRNYMNFFGYDDVDEKKDAKNGGIAIVDYWIDVNDHVVINGHGEMKPLKQHQEDLRKEFGNVKESN